MGIFSNDEDFADPQTQALTKKVESFQHENKALKEKVGRSVFIDSSERTDTINKLKEMLVVLEVLRKLEKEEYKLDVNDSEKYPGGISVGVVDAKTKKQVLAITAEGKDKKEKVRMGNYQSSWYDYVVSKMTLSFPIKGDAEFTHVTVPKFLVDDFAYHILDHITAWSNNKDSQTSEVLDTVLTKLEA